METFPKRKPRAFNCWFKNYIHPKSPKGRKSKAQMKKLYWWAAMLNPCLKRQYPLEASRAAPDHTIPPSLQSWCQTLCTAGPQTLLSKRTLFVFIWFAFCWTSKKNQLMTHAGKHQGWCKRGHKVHIQLEGEVGGWVKKKPREDIFVLQTHQWQSSLLKRTTGYPSSIPGVMGN